ncbi:MAG: YggS family pyridoxal phosphate-dependent enzyme [Actinomycetales bacterium]|nr:MAG: YggS family pyridoxal phosphate-dependent enzyme [Actinomycetales bacterium]
MNNREVEIETNLAQVISRIEKAAKAAGRSVEEITLVAVTKTFPVSDIEFLYQLGIRNFGENRNQEGSIKAPQLPDDCIWHFQGQIQSNKLKSIALWADVIHSLDDASHAKKLSSLVANKDIFIQLSLDSQPNRGGVAPEELDGFARAIAELGNLKVRGLMAVAPLDEDPNLGFARLKLLSNQLVKTLPMASEMSAGMSNDFESAIAQGATLIRIGSQILGVR